MTENTNYVQAQGDTVDEAVADALAQVVVLGGRPTPRALELAEAVSRHVSARTSPLHTYVPAEPGLVSETINICPTCGGTGRAVKDEAP